MAGRTLVKAIGHPSGSRRVEIYRRDDGTFGFDEWVYRADESAWSPFGRYSYAITDTPERAEQEARSRVSWLLVNRQT